MGLALTRAVEEGVLHRDQKGHYYLPDYQPGGLHNRLPPGASSAAAAATADGIRTNPAAARAIGVRGGDVTDLADVRLKQTKVEVLPGGGGGGPYPRNRPPRPGPSRAEELEGPQHLQLQQQDAESHDKENQDEENRAARRRLSLRAPLAPAPLSSHQLGRLERPSPLRCAGTVRHAAVTVPVGGGLDSNSLF